MAQQTPNYKQYEASQQFQSLIDMGIYKRIPIQENETPYDDIIKQGAALPDGVYYSFDVVSKGAHFYKVERVISEEQTNDMILSLTASNIKKIRDDVKIIKGCTIFFTVMAVLGIIGYIIGSMSV